MKNNLNKYPVSDALRSITQEQVTELDQESTGGEGWEYYSKGFVSGATVCQDVLLGQIRELSAVNNVEIKVRGQEIYTSCSCSRTGGVCHHAIALLYAWVDDAENFIDVGKAINELAQLDKEQLVKILQRILIRAPKFISLAVGRFTEEDSDVNEEDFFDEEGFN